MSDKPTVDPILYKFLPKPSVEHVARLQKKLEIEGCRDVIVVWKEQNIIVDGMTRFELCESLGIPYGMTYLSFPDLDHVKEWMVDNQLARRNLTDEQRTYFLGKKYLAQKNSPGRQKDKVVNGATLTGKTAETLGNEHDVSPKTVRNAAKFAEAVDAHEAAKPGAKDEILSGEAGTKSKVVQTAPVLCKRCAENGAARNCRWCAEEAAKRDAGKRAKSDDSPFVDHRRLPPAGATESEDADLLTSCEKGGGHPFLELMQDVRNLSAKITRAMKADGEDAMRLHTFLGWCGLLDHPPGKGGEPIFLPLKGVSKVIDMAGGGGKMPTQQKVVSQYQYACGGKLWVPPATKRRRDAKKARA